MRPSPSRAALRARGRLRDLAAKVESSLASPQAAVRLASEQPTGLRRAVTATLLDTAVSNPKLTGRLIGRNLPDDLQYLGLGYHSVVYRSADGTVLKVNRHSIHVSEDRRRQIAAAERSAHDVVQSYLGDLPIAQEIVVGPHPAAPGLRAVMIVQDYCTYLPLDDVFPEGHAGVDRAALDRLVRAHPGTADGLRRLARGGLSMAEHERLVPDVCGRGNVGLLDAPAPRVVLVDRQPMRAGHRHARAIVIPQLTDLLHVLDGEDVAEPAPRAYAADGSA